MKVCRRDACIEGTRHADIYQVLLRLLQQGFNTLDARFGLAVPPVHFSIDEIHTFWSSRNSTNFLKTGVLWTPEAITWGPSVLLRDVWREATGLACGVWSNSEGRLSAVCTSLHAIISTGGSSWHLVTLFAWYGLGRSRHYNNSVSIGQRFS